MFYSFTLAITNYDCKTKAESAEIIRMLEFSLCSNRHKYWSNLGLILILSKRYHFLNLRSTIPKLIRILHGVWVKKGDDKDSTSNALAKIKKLNGIVAHVAKSRPVENFVNHNILDNDNILDVVCYF